MSEYLYCKVDVLVLSSSGLTDLRCPGGFDVIQAPEVQLASSIDRLNDTLIFLFSFDPLLFGIITFSCLLLFVKGWGAGVILRLLRKQS